MLNMTDEMRAMITQRSTTEELKVLARKQGMCTLFEDAMIKVKDGVTSLAEALVTARPDVESFIERKPV